MIFSNSPVFIVGCGRSGTTLLRVILNRHPNIAIPEETWYFPDLNNKRDIFMGLKNWELNVSNYIYEYSRRHFPDLTKESILNELQQTDSENWPAIVGSNNRYFARKEGKNRWGDKTPGYVLHIPLLKELYPQAKVIHMIRDGRDVVPSILRYWEVGPQTNSYIQTVYYWKKQVLGGLTDGKKYFGDNYIEIRYEDLITSPEITVRNICSFIDEAYSPSLIEIKANNSKLYVPGWEHHENTFNPINSGNISLWKNNLDKYKIQIAQLVGRRILQRFNYELEKIFSLKAYSHYLSFLVFQNFKKVILKIKILIFNIIHGISNPKS